jgi:hypothetical protein
LNGSLGWKGIKPIENRGKKKDYAMSNTMQNIAKIKALEKGEKKPEQFASNPETNAIPTAMQEKNF